MENKEKTIEQRLEEIEKRLLKLETDEKARSDFRANMISKEPYNNRSNKKFELFWDNYPHRLGKKLNKKSAQRAFSRVDNQDIEKVMAAVSNYSESLCGLSEYAQNAWKWLSEENWKEYTD